MSVPGSLLPLPVWVQALMCGAMASPSLRCSAFSLITSDRKSTTDYLLCVCVCRRRCVEPWRCALCNDLWLFSFPGVHCLPLLSFKSPIPCCCHNHLSLASVFCPSTAHSLPEIFAVRHKRPILSLMLLLDEVFFSP